jgi:hypothetical protein
MLQHNCKTEHHIKVGITFLLRCLEVPGLKLGQKIGYPGWFSFCSFIQFFQGNSEAEPPVKLRTLHMSNIPIRNSFSSYHSTLYVCFYTTNKDINVLSLNEVVFCERGHLTLATPVSGTVQGVECNVSKRRAWRWLVRVEIFSIIVYIVINCIKDITCVDERQTLLQCQCDKTALLSKYIGTSPFAVMHERWQCPLRCCTFSRMKLRGIPVLTHAEKHS